MKRGFHRGFLSLALLAVLTPGLFAGHDVSIAAAGVRAGGGVRTCVFHFNRYWEPYPFAGIAFDFPTAISRVFFRTTFDAGIITDRSEQSTRLFALHTSFCCMTDLWQSESVRVRTGFGVSSATFSFTSALELDAKPFSTSESEFGAVATLEPSWRRNRFELTVPLSFSGILSLPHPLFSVAAGIMAGGVF